MPVGWSLYASSLQDDGQNCFLSYMGINDANDGSRGDLEGISGVVRCRTSLRKTRSTVFVRTLPCEINP